MKEVWYPPVRVKTRCLRQVSLSQVSLSLGALTRHRLDDLLNQRVYSWLTGADPWDIRSNSTRTCADRSKHIYAHTTTSGAVREGPRPRVHHY